jgi:hypothetical protein
VEIGFTTIPRFKFGDFDGKDYGKWGHRLSRMLRTLADDLHESLKARAAGLK